MRPHEGGSRSLEFDMTGSCNTRSSVSFPPTLTLLPTLPLIFHHAQLHPSTLFPVPAPYPSLYIPPSPSICHSSLPPETVPLTALPSPSSFYFSSHPHTHKVTYPHPPTYTHSRRHPKLYTHTHVHGLTSLFYPLHLLPPQHTRSQ